MKNWTFSELDQQIAAQPQAQLPPALFDAYAHLWRTADMAQPVSGLWAEGPAEAGAAAWRRPMLSGQMPRTGRISSPTMRGSCWGSRANRAHRPRTSIDTPRKVYPAARNC